MEKKGSALIMVLLFAVIFYILGFALLELAQIEQRISRNVALYDRLYYYAEAGIEEAVARLPRSYGLFAEYSGVFEREGPPAYRVEVADDGAGKLISATGLAEGKSRLVVARAGMNLLGEHALLAGGEVRLGRARVQGNVRGSKITFTAGESVVQGSLYACCVESEWDSSYFLGGRWCPPEEIDGWGLDFDYLAEAANFFYATDWYIPVNMDNYDWKVVAEEADREKIYLPGALLVDEHFYWDGLVVVRGDVEWRAGVVEGDFLLLAEGDIVLGASFVQEEGSGAFYSGGSILDCREDKSDAIMARGVFVAAEEIELDNVEVVYDEAALWLYRQDLKPDSFAGLASFWLEWINPEPRR